MGAALDLYTKSWFSKEPGEEAPHSGGCVMGRKGKNIGSIGRFTYSKKFMFLKFKVMVNVMKSHIKCSSQVI